MLAGAAAEGTGAAGNDEAVIARNGCGVGDVALPAQHDAVAGSSDFVERKAVVVGIADELSDEGGSGAAGGEQEVFVCGDGERGDQALPGFKVGAHLAGVQVVRLDVAVARAEKKELLIETFV